MQYLRTGSVPEAKPVQPRHSGQMRDVLSATTPVKNYVGYRLTKSFLLHLAHRMDPNVKDKSGQWCWLNDWRREQQSNDSTFTYQDLASRPVELMNTAGRLPQIPSARMNNFITDFRADPVNRSATREQVLAAWTTLKEQPGPKTYEHYRNNLA